MENEPDPFQLGEQAARRGATADECPFEMGRKRKAWFAGYFSAKPPREEDDEPADDADER